MSEKNNEIIDLPASKAPSEEEINTIQEASDNAQRELQANLSLITSTEYNANFEPEPTDYVYTSKHCQNGLICALELRLNVIDQKPKFVQILKKDEPYVTITNFIVRDKYNLIPVMSDKFRMFPAMFVARNDISFKICYKEKPKKLKVVAVYKVDEKKFVYSNI